MIRLVVDLVKARQILISAHDIGDPVTLSLSDGNATSEQLPDGSYRIIRPDTRGEIHGHVRAITFTTGKVRYAIRSADGATTLRNVDSAFVRPWYDGDPLPLDVLGFDNFD